MQKYIDDCDRRIDTAQRRLEKTPDEIRQTNDIVRSIFPGFYILLSIDCIRNSNLLCSSNKLPIFPTLSTAVSLKYPF